jgi:hypothetical protein
MSINHINVCIHRLMFVKKDKFGKGVMQCKSDRQKCEIGCVKNVICGIRKCCSLSSFVVRLFATSFSNLRVSFRVLAQCNLLGKGVKSSFFQMVQRTSTCYQVYIHSRCFDESLNFYKTSKRRWIR